MVYKNSAKPRPSDSMNESVTEEIHLKNREGVGPGHLFHLLHHLPVGDLNNETGQSGVINQFSYKNRFTREGMGGG
jgi:hypothetical protein